MINENPDFLQNPYAAPQVQSPIAVEGDQQYGPEGIGGWLILPLLGLVFTPMAAIVTLVTQNIPPFTEGHFSTLTNPAFAGYHPLWGALLIFEPIGTVTVGAMAVWGLVLMFRKAKQFPRFMIAFYTVNMFIVIVDTVLGFQIPIVAEKVGPAMLGQVGRACIVAAIWIPYMRKSRRVKNTFVR